MPTLESRAVLRDVIRRAADPQRGVDLLELRQSIRVLDALERADGTLEIEDADYDHLKAKLLGFTWGLVDRRLARVIDDVLDAGG